MKIWIFLAIAIGFEVAGTLLLKASDGFAKPIVGMAAIFCYTICFWFFAPVLKVLPAGVAYAVWAGVGIAAVSVLGVVLFKQSLNFSQMGFIALILVGAVGLNLSTTTSL